MMSFSDRLRSLRHEKGINQSELAAYIGVSAQSYSTYENGREPNYDILRALAKYFDCSTDYLLGMTEYRKLQEIKESSQLFAEYEELLGKIHTDDREVIELSMNYVMNTIRAIYAYHYRDFDKGWEEAAISYAFVSNSYTACVHDIIKDFSDRIAEILTLIDEEDGSGVKIDQCRLACAGIVNNAVLAAVKFSKNLMRAIQHAYPDFRSLFDD